MMDPHKILAWFDANARPLPWRRPGTSAWGVLLSEVMSQQTPVARVSPVWEEWMRRWPTPEALAQASTAEVLRAWGRLGYPRRALRLHECAQVIGAGPVPSRVEDLLALPGIGDYTARAVACFHFGKNVPVVDTNVRRVLARAVHGRFMAPPASKRELEEVAQLLPDREGPRFSASLMELGALVCQARNPQCELCPLVEECAWVKAGKPQAAGRVRPAQKYAGTDRQVRGIILAALRAADAPLPRPYLDSLWSDSAQLHRALNSLAQDGLAEQTAAGLWQLPGFTGSV